MLLGAQSLPEFLDVGGMWFEFAQSLDLLNQLFRGALLDGLCHAGPQVDHFGDELLQIGEQRAGLLIPQRDGNLFHERECRRVLALVGEMLGLCHALEQIRNDLLAARREIFTESVRLADAADQLAVIAGHEARLDRGQMLHRLEQFAFTFQQRGRLQNLVELGDGRFDGRCKLDAAFGAELLGHRVQRLAAQTRLPQPRTATAAVAPFDARFGTAVRTACLEWCHASRRLGGRTGH